MLQTRREFITTSLAGLAGAGLTGWLPSPARAAGVVREFRFTAAQSTIDLGGGPAFKALTFNGQAPGPAIRVTEGEVVRVVLDNRLEAPTTIHWHGIPLINAMDGVPGVTQEAVKPGGSFVYQFKAEPAGTFFYHSHVGLQLDQGLYGPLIIEPRQRERPADREFVLMLEDWATVDGGGPAATRRRPPGGMGMMGRGMMGGMRGRAAGGPPLEPIYDAFAVNGRTGAAVAPLTVEKGQRVRLRLINSSAVTIYYLRLAGHQLTITHCDGNPVSPLSTDVLRMGPGERYDLEFIADNPGRWLLGAAEGGFGESGLKVPVIYQGTAPGAPTPPSFERSARLAGYYDLKAARPAAQPPGRPDRVYNQLLSGGMHSSWWTINGRTFPDSERLAVQKGQRVRLSYFNRSMMPHPMHLHGHFFRVVTPGLGPAWWVNKDTVLVDPMQRMDIEFMADNPGDWIHHCHNLYHMEAGMANLVTYTA